MSLKRRSAYIYEVFYAAAEFGEEYVAVEADTREAADLMIDEWCETNYAISSKSASGLGPKPRLVQNGYLYKKGSSPSAYGE